MMAELSIYHHYYLSNQPVIQGIGKLTKPTQKKQCRNKCLVVPSFSYIILICNDSKITMKNNPPWSSGRGVRETPPLTSMNTNLKVCTGCRIVQVSPQFVPMAQWTLCKAANNTRSSDICQVKLRFLLVKN